MTTSDLYILNTKSTKWLCEFVNGWGTGPCIWDHLASKYYPEVNFTDYNRADYVGWDRKNSMVWDLAENTQVTAEERLVLMMTFERSFIPKKHLKLAGEACKTTDRLIKKHGFWKGVNHWRAIGDALLTLSDQKLHHKARGVALNCTSVANFWRNPDADYLTRTWPILNET